MNQIASRIELMELIQTGGSFEDALPHVMHLLAQRKLLIRDYGHRVNTVDNPCYMLNRINEDIRKLLHLNELSV